MIRLTEIHGGQAGGAALRRDFASLEVFSQILSARSFRSRFFVERLRSGSSALLRWTGLSGLFTALRRRVRKHRTLHALASLDDRLLNDIGVARADIEATAAFCCEDNPATGDSVWYGLHSWAQREVRRRRTERELSAMSDKMLRDIGVERWEIPAVAAAVAEQHRFEATDPGATGTSHLETLPPRVSAQVIAFTELRRSLRRSFEPDHNRSTAA